jgi:hypothetical protein
MKAVLEFNLPEEESDFNLACKGKDWWYVCWELDQYLRGQLKYNDNISEDTREAYKDLRYELLQTISDRNISLDDVK